MNVMTLTEQKEYAEYLIRRHVESFEGLTAHEMFDEYVHDVTGGWPAVPLPDVDINDVLDLIRSAKVEVSW